jgi:signal-transduction protein with cAMP-binding, CBS, and nucleotidyltransferase domain
MKASDIMTEGPVCTCGCNASVQEVSDLMKRHNVGAVPILDEQGMLEGIVTDRDLCCRVLAEGRSSQTCISDVMSKSVQYVRPDDSLQEIESMMKQFKIHRVPVVDDQMKPIGFISVSDLLHHCRSPQEEHELTETLETVTTYR